MNSGSASFKDGAEHGRVEERKRCAEIARSHISQDKDWDTSLWNQACERIALKIETADIVR